MEYNSNLPADSQLAREIPREIRDKGESLKALIDIESNKSSSHISQTTDAHGGIVSQVDFDELLAKYNDTFFYNQEGFRNSIYRGKNLGNSYTTQQQQAVSSGSFDDMFIGDYWTIGGVNWRIAAFNYYRNTGDTSLSGNHITIVPDTMLYNHAMNSTNITTGGYVGSEMYTDGLTQAKTTINNAFSGHVVSHRKYLSNAVSDGMASGVSWYDSTVELMNEIMVYGSRVNGSAIQGLFDIGVEKSQLPLFALNPQSINTRQSYWLRDVVSASTFAHVDHNGNANLLSASFSRGVRPAFSIS